MILPNRALPGEINMADYEIPDDLLQLKKDFLANESDYPKAQTLALEIHRHPWWKTVDNPVKAGLALQAAAKS